MYTAKKIVATWSNGKDVVQLRGTGFFIDRKTDIILITNRHVVEPGYSDAKFRGYVIIDFSIEGYESFTETGVPQKLQLCKILNFQEFIFSKNPSNDIACLKKVQIIGGDATIVAPIPLDMIATSEWLNNKLSVCDSIAYPGYPDWFDKKNNTPIFRMGTIASDPRLNYSNFMGEPVADRIAYEGFSTGGASGSPVFAVQRGFNVGEGLSAPDGFYREVKLIGINAGHFTNETGHSGISYLYKSSAILEIINETA